MHLPCRDSTESDKRAGCNRAPAKNIALDHHAARQRRSFGRTAIQPLSLPLPEPAHQRSVIVERTLALMPRSSRFSAGSAAQL